LGSTSRISTEKDGDESSGFFAKKVKSFIPSSFFEEVDRIERDVESYTRNKVLEIYASLQTKSIRIEPTGRGKLLVKTEISEASAKGYISPSMFVKYRRCARELAIEIMESKKLGGVIVTVDQLKSYLKGVLVHRLFYDTYAYGEKEVRVESAKLGILGYIDEVRRELDRYMLIEVKSSHKPDIVGAGLQVMSYMYAFMDQNGLSENQVEGYLITRIGTYRIFLDSVTFDEYMKRLRKVVEVAVNERIDELPPRLSAKLSSRCEVCPYRSECFSLPDRYRSYDRYFEAMGFKKLAEKRPVNTLDKYFHLK